MSNSSPPRAARGAAALIAVALPVLAGCGGQEASSPPEGGEPVSRQTVQIANFTYRPAVAAVRTGGSVTWTNRDQAPHTATADDRRSFDTGTLQRGQSKTIRLTRPGTYSYFCVFHRFMVARVVVK